MNSVMLKKLVFIALLCLVFASCGEKNEEAQRPLTPTVGAVNARFSVSNKVTVVFAKGNLQYQPSSGTWRLASNQYDVVGQSNAEISNSYQGWVDLFGWGTSGNNGLYPYIVFDSSSRYVTGAYDISGTNYDWGLFNPISNAGNTAGQWRTLTRDEWRYVLNLRDGASSKRGLATIENVDGQGTNVCGMLLLPDSWKLPKDCEFHPGVSAGFSLNVYSRGDFNLLESAGAVFFPCGGYRSGRSVEMVNEYGGYWTTTYFTENASYEFYFYDGSYDVYHSARANGHSVRLVQNK